VLRSRHDGKQTFYRIAEPLFRFWLEYRTADWRRTRVAWVSHLLQTLLAPTDLAKAWWENPDEEMRAAAALALRKVPQAQSAAEETILDEAISARESPERFRAVLRRVGEIEADTSLVKLLIYFALSFGRGAEVEAELSRQLPQ